jgi:glycerol-3-phosphate acyltransferase PlsY
MSYNINYGTFIITMTDTILLSPAAYYIYVFSYVLGSVPFGLILTKLAGLGDIRKQGSGNIGATNVLRTGNKKLALLTLVLDAVKGVIPVLIAKHYISVEVAAIAALLAVIGHMFPVWLKFKGGKGVATTLGVVLAIHFPLGLIACGTWLAVFYVSRYSSLSSLTSMIATAIGAYFLTSNLVFCAMLCLAVLVFIRHHANIRRLIKGEESKSSFKKST